MARRNDILERKDEILEWINDNISKAEMSKRLGCNPKTINPILKRLGIEYEGNKGNRKGTVSKKWGMSFEEYSKTVAPQSYKLKKKMLNEKIKPHKCEECQGEEWLGHPIPLELHHVDGNRFNNVLENLQLLCPNCHSTTDNYRGKNVGMAE